MYLLINYTKRVLCRVAKRLSYIENARCLKVTQHKKVNVSSIHSGRVDENGGEMKPFGLKSLLNEVTGLASVPVRCTELALRH